MFLIIYSNISKDLAGSEVVMMTNKEIVANISANDGRLYTESFPLPKVNHNRINWKYEVNENQKIKASIPSDPVPFNLNIYKGV